MNLSDAEVVVTTQKEIDDGTHTSDWFRLSEYGDSSEFYNVCYSYFPDENNPIFRYPAWENIPDLLITREWFCPNFFEIRDAMERLDESEVDLFMEWCNYHGHNLASDDPHLLVVHYQDNHTAYPMFETDTPDIPTDPFIYQSLSDSYFDTDRYMCEVSSDMYD